MTHTVTSSSRLRAFVRVLGLVTVVGFAPEGAMATEEAQYAVVERAGDFEVRDYAGYILAETEVPGGMERASNAAFGLLFGYISGRNQARGDIAMTSPVMQASSGEKIAMTAPVGQQASETGWVVSFMMPSQYTLETLPVPEDPRVSLRAVPAQRVAAVRYSGGWGEARYRDHKALLDRWISESGFTVTGDAVWARYDAPYKPWFMRRNEILIPISAD